jgi:hypothetical protein
VKATTLPIGFGKKIRPEIIMIKKKKIRQKKELKVYWK